jgi:xylulokinase
MSLVLACDLGGTSFRAALIDAAGITRAEATIRGPVILDRMGGAEVDAKEWWRVFAEAAGRLAAEHGELFGSIRAIAICGVTRTQVFLGRDNRQIRPAITWKDMRSEGAAARFRAKIAGDHPELHRINAFHPLARLAFLKEEEEAAFRSLALVVEPKDYLNFRLTGRLASDSVSMARLAAAAEPEGETDLFATLGLARSVVPALVEPWEVLASVSGDLPAPFDRLAGVPVLAASSDTWVGALGLGAMRAGFGYNISGTTEVFGVVGETPSAAEGLLTVDWRGLHQLGGPSQTGADTMSWLIELLGSDAADLPRTVDALLAAPRHPQPVIFLPYLQGERVPYWDPALRGAFLGLNRQHRPVDLAYAVIEGIAFLNRLVLERAEAATGVRVSEIRFGGGAASNAVWRQAKADIMNRPIVAGEAREPGLLGAAMLAFAGVGHFPSLDAAQEAMVRIAARHLPNPARRAAYDRLYALFRDAEAALVPVSHGLAELARQSAALPGVHDPLYAENKEPSS